MLEKFYEEEECLEHLTQLLEVSQKSASLSYIQIDITCEGIAESLEIKAREVIKANIDKIIKITINKKLFGEKYQAYRITRGDYFE